jgi:hypothetical protein
MIWWRDLREDQTTAPVNMDAVDVWIEGEPYDPGPDPDPDFPEHFVFATAPGTLVEQTGAGVVENATGFYTGGAAEGWKVKGARFTVASGLTVPSTAEVNLYVTNNTVPTLGTPTKTVSMTGITTGVNRVDFPSVTLVNPGEVFYIGIKLPDNSYLEAANVFGESWVQASDGSPLYLADRVPNVGLDRNYRKVGTDAQTALTDSQRDSWFGTEPVLEEDAA